MWHTAKWERHLHYKCIQAYHTHTYTRSPIQMDCLHSRCWAQHWAAGERLQLFQSHCSLSLSISHSLLPPYSLWLSIILTCYAFMPPLSHSLSLSPALLASLSLTAPVIMPHPSLLLSSSLPVCFRLHISSSNWLFSVPAELHSPVFGKRTFRCGTLGIFHLAAHSSGRLSEGRPVLSWSFRNTLIIRFAAHQSPGVCCIAVCLLRCTRTALIVSVRSVGWRKPPSARHQPEEEYRWGSAKISGGERVTKGSKTKRRVKGKAVSHRLRRASNGGTDKISSCFEREREFQKERGRLSFVNSKQVTINYSVLESQSRTPSWYSLTFRTSCVSFFLLKFFCS